MTPDEARDLFSDALETELPAEVRASFEAALASDAELASEFDAFKQMLEGTRSLGRRYQDVPAPNLLPRIQRTIRARTKGRYYRDRSGRVGADLGFAIVAMVAAALVLVLVFAAYVSGLW
jgi:anti-sigma factor RsiW